MTNKPTIDGVSRELLAGISTYTVYGPYEIQKSWAADMKKLRELLSSNPEENVPCPKCGGSLRTWGCTCDPRWPFYKNEPAAECSMIAPAVEQQEPELQRFNTAVSHGGSYERVVLEEHRNGHVMRSNDVVKHVAALQSTIAKLQARIGELESGMGEPVAWMYKREGGEILGQLVQMESDDLKFIRLGKCHDDGTRYMWPREDYIEWKPLFTAPPAPVAAPEKYDDVLLPFLALMRTELHANAHKGDRPGWLQMDSKTAILEVFYHMGKLHQAVHRGEEAAIKEYAADVANMCMMLLDVCACLDATAALNGERK